jgi:hypothetical protein
MAATQHSVRSFQRNSRPGFGLSGRNTVSGAPGCSARSLAGTPARPDSDTDLLVQYVLGQSGFAFVRFCRKVEELLGRKVDVATERSLHPLIQERVPRANRAA